MGTSDFFKQVKSSKDAFQEGREAKATGGMIDVDPGRYVVRLQSVDLDVADRSDGKNVPFVQFNTVVVSSPNENSVGSMIRHREWIKALSGVKKEKGKKDRPWEITEADCFANICRVFQSFGVDTSELELSELEELAKDLSESQPACRVTVKEKGEYLNARFGKSVSDDSLPSIEDVLGDDGDNEESDDNENDDESDDGDDDEDDDESDDNDDDEFIPPSKGEVLDAKPKGTRKVDEYEVTAVNAKARTCTLKRVRDGKLFKDEPWDAIVDDDGDDEDDE